jgi:hypothetical protein
VGRWCFSCCTWRGLDPQRLRREPEDLARALLRVEPQEGQVREVAFQDLAILANLADHAAADLQMVGRRQNEAAHEIEAVAPARQRHGGFCGEFGGQFAHDLLAHIGRIGDDEIIAPPLEGREEIAMEEADALALAAAPRAPCSLRGGASAFIRVPFPLSWSR